MHVQDVYATDGKVYKADRTSAKDLISVLVVDGTVTTTAYIVTTATTVTTNTTFPNT